MKLLRYGDKGVGMGCKPPQYLRPGMQLRLGVEGLGEQSMPVVQGV